MDINVEKIKSLRQSKGWTQQHLASACDLSLRTIQRVERHGAASKETALSLCSVLEQTMENIIPHAEEIDDVKIVALYTQVPVFVFGCIFGVLLMKIFA